MAHAHSIAAFLSDLEGGRLSARAQQILDLAADGQPRTDRRAMIELGYEDMNSVRPRITELIQAGVLHEVSTTIDFRTGKRVRIWRVATLREYRASKGEHVEPKQTHLPFA